MKITYPEGAIVLAVGIAGYPVAYLDSKTNETYVLDGHYVDGYDVNDIFGFYPGANHQDDLKDGRHVFTEEFYDTDEFKTAMKVPTGFEFYCDGMNDQWEGGYVIFTNGQWRREDIMFNDDGFVLTREDVLQGCDPSEKSLKLDKEGQLMAEVWDAPHSDQ